MVNGKKVKVYSLVMITDAAKQRILLGLKKRGLCGNFKFSSDVLSLAVESTVLYRQF